MAHKRRDRKRFPCPSCGLDLWRLGSKKYYLYYEYTTDIVQSMHVSRKKAALLAANGLYCDQDAWLESFFCREHGIFWLVLRRDSQGCLSASASTAQDWKHTAGTGYPDHPNPSISEFSFRSSRRATITPDAGTQRHRR